MQEVDNIIRILKETRQAINDSDSYKIKQLSNQTVHTSTITQDPDNIIVAVVVYVIGKILERENYKELEGWKEFYESLMKNLDSAIQNLEKNNIEAARTNIGKIRNSANKIEGSLKEYVKDIFYKAEINKAFKMYEHGLTSEKTAELLGVSLWDLSSYIGQTTISESHLSISLPVKERIRRTEEFFS